ncbi:MAG TPA: Gfo/Idh/MocA family oxidoreductase [Bacteroidetes bacterium]|nr:Gfo/Idh/MocA family oxidoreductase [Candidatus Limimorpha avicola]
MKHTIALIGCGRISFKHIEAYVNNKDRLELVATCDPVIERAEAKKNEYVKALSGTQVKVYADYKAMPLYANIVVA